MIFDVLGFDFIHCERISSSEHQVSAITCSKDRNPLVIYSTRQTLHAVTVEELLDVSHRVRKTHLNMKNVTALAFLAEQQLVVSGSDNGKILQR